MKKQNEERKEGKKAYEKPVLVRHQNLRAITGQPNGSSVPLGCTRRL